MSDHNERRKGAVQNTKTECEGVVWRKQEIPTPTHKDKPSTKLTLPPQRAKWREDY